MQTERPSINEEYLLEQIAQMDQIILKAMGAKEIMTGQLQYLRSIENGDKPKQEEKTAGPQPKTEEQYANGNNCRAGDCD